jgi:hypothetical protein
MERIRSKNGTLCKSRKRYSNSGYRCRFSRWCQANLGGTWVQTSYNTHGNVNSRVGGIALHKNYAGIGYTWDGTGFAAPQPFASWSLNSDTYLWEAPTPMPVEEGKRYTWDEATTSWIEV